MAVQPVYDIRIACFSQDGEMLANKLGFGKVTRFPGDESVREWTREGFCGAQALVFIGSCQIAVRSIAPFIRSKLTDPAVVAVDETGTYVIPLLSGHMGGANDLAERIAVMLGSVSVITTATDRRHTFAPDRWAAENGFGIVNPEAVKNISAAVLDGEEIVISVRGRRESDLKSSDAGPADKSAAALSRSVRLVPRTIVIGSGCRKGTDPAYMESCFMDFCEEHGIECACVACLASIDLKKDENALKALARNRRIPFLTYSAGELMKLRGGYSASGFVLEKTGADNVCERAAVRACLEEWKHLPEADLEAYGRLFVRKQSYDGITFAAARVKSVRRWGWQE